MPFGFSVKGAKGFKYGKTYGQGIRQMLRTGVNKNGSHEMSIKKKLKSFWFLVDICLGNVNQRSKRF